MGAVSGVVGIANEVTEHNVSEFKQQSVLDVLKALREAVTYVEMLPIILDQTNKLFHPDGIALAIGGNSNDGMELAASSGIWKSLSKGILFPSECTWQPGECLIISSDEITPDELKTDVEVSITGIQLIVQEKQVGILWLANRYPIKVESSNELVDYGEIIANAINRARNYEQTQIQLKRLAALHEIDRAITNISDINITFSIILYHVLVQLRVDAAVILLLNPTTQRLEYSFGKGFQTDRINSVSIPINECHVNQKSCSKNYSICSKFFDDGNSCLMSSLENSERFTTYFGSPLVIRGQIKGVLGLFHRSEKKPGDEWFSFLETIATQAAIAVDNAALFNDLQLTNKELTMAYETTLEGWVRALDLRDKETEGHTQRVTEMTLRLAQELGINKTSLPHIRRGALLHDIGKMGISDKILKKTGPLSDDEWIIMKRHPVYAKNLLTPITFLHQSIDIPYYHHEKWDGTGYPLGLVGEAIPLAARIFAVIDVWDALRSNRPYRPAWSLEKTKQYLLNESGKHFDPLIINRFFELGMDKSPE